jgi:GT2 family glycosyltransferase
MSPNTQAENQTGDSPQVSVVIPTYYRPDDLVRLLDNLNQQVLLPSECVIVDGAPAEERASEEQVAAFIDRARFMVRYFRSERGTARQRNFGVQQACFELICFIDDDMILEPTCLKELAAAFDHGDDGQVGGVLAFTVNQSVPDSRRWRWHRRIRLFFKDLTPGRYHRCGQAVPNYLQPPFKGVRIIELMGTQCAMWRKQVAEEFPFDDFFTDYGTGEDGHMSLRAGKSYLLLHCGDAHCYHLHSPGGRDNPRLQGFKTVYNYHFIWCDIITDRTWRDTIAFWSFQVLQAGLLAFHGIVKLRAANFLQILGRIQGAFSAIRRSRVTGL